MIYGFSEVYLFNVIFTCDMIHSSVEHFEERILALKLCLPETFTLRPVSATFTLNKDVWALS